MGARTRNLLIICTTLIVVGIIFWPSLYRYQTLKLGNNSFPVKINRVTGSAEYFSSGGWISFASKEEGKAKNSVQLPDSEKAKISGNGDLSVSQGEFSGGIYNGSSWMVTSIAVRILLREFDGSVKWDRKFVTGVLAEPFSSGFFYIKLPREGREDTKDQQLWKDLHKKYSDILDSVATHQPLPFEQPRTVPKTSNPFDQFDVEGRQRGRNTRKRFSSFIPDSPSFDWHIEAVFGYRE